jgi:hypothetical protein
MIDKSQAQKNQLRQKLVFKATHKNNKCLGTADISKFTWVARALQIFAKDFYENNKKTGVGRLLQSSREPQPAL